MLQYSYLILHLVMIAVGTYFMADMANLTLASHLEALFHSSDLTSASSTRLTNGATRNGAQDYQVIIQKNIFNSASKPTQGTQTSKIGLPAEPPNLAPLNLTLVGTAVLKGIPAFAVIKDPKEKNQKLYRKGDVIGALFPGDKASKPKIIEIKRNKIVLLRGKVREELEVKVTSGKSTPVAKRVSKRSQTPKASNSPSADSTIRQVSEGQWLLDRRELDDALKNLPQLLTKARVIPSFKDGKPDGFRIFAIAKDSLYAKIGLQNGDILHRINGVDVKNPQNFMQVIEQLKDESNINIDLVRNNNRETFSYEIR